MSDYSFLDSFRNPHTGDFDYTSSSLAGNAERESGFPLTPQAPDESWPSFSTRSDAYCNGKSE
jgi:hypothetical protein